AGPCGAAPTCWQVMVADRGDVGASRSQDSAWRGALVRVDRAEDLRDRHAEAEGRQAEAQITEFTREPEGGCTPSPVRRNGPRKGPGGPMAHFYGIVRGRSRTEATR